MQALLTIDRAALRANITAISRHIGKTPIVAVVKANGYGHGIDLVAQAVADLAVGFGVYETSEAARLRELGITTPIHLLGPTAPDEFAAAITADATISVWNHGTWLRELTQTARRLQRPARVQLKIESGLHRLGAAPAEIHTLRDTVLRSEECRLEGAYSHLAAAEELDSRYTIDQLETFERAVPLGSVPQRHIAASAAAMLWPQTRLDLVRLGIALYGIWPSPATQRRMHGSLHLQPALRWTTTLVAIQEVAAEEPVGYGCTYRPPETTRIGILPIGYAEGLPRALSNTGTVVIDGTRCPIVGRVCMNMAFVDLHGVPRAHVGSTVTLIGRDGDEHIDIEEVAHACLTIGYEIAARLPATIPRVLVDTPQAAVIAS